MKKLLSCVASALLCACAAFAESVVVGNQETVDLHADGAATLSDRVVQGEYGRLYKTGTGTLTVQQQAISGAPVRMGVLSGTVKLDNTTAVTPATPTAPTAMSKAALWLDAAEKTSLRLANGDPATDPGPCAEAQGIARWYDRREATPGTTHVYPYGVSSNALGTTMADIGLPQYFTTNSNTKGAVHFGKYSSGRYLDLYWASGNQLEFNYTVTHVFFVYGFFETWGYYLGRRAGDAHWYNSSSHTIAQMPFLTTARITTVPTAFTAATYVNGAWIDQFTQRPDQGFGLIRQDYVEQRAYMTSIMATKAQTNGGQTGSKSGVGGDFLCEALVFTNVLTGAECAAIEDYLMTKWDLPRKRAGVNRQEYALAPNTTLEAETAANQDTIPVAVSGTGALVKKGAGMMSITASSQGTFSGTVDLQAGSIVSRGGRLPPVKAMPGTELTADEYGSTGESTARDTKNGVRLTKVTVSGKNFTKKGTGELRVNALDEEIARVSVEGGTLTLEAPLASAPLVETAADMRLSVTNASFEMSAVLGEYWPSATETNGWWQDGGQTWYSATDQFMNWSVPLGSQCIRTINGTSDAYTTVNLPAAGTYEFAFRYTARTWENTSTMRGWGRQTMNLVLAKTSQYTKAQAGSFPVIASFLTQTAPWPRVRYRFTVTEAGDYYIGFRNRNYSIDNYTYYDDISLHYVAEAVRSDVWPIPDGDFEQIPANVKNWRAFASEDKDGGHELATGWTFTSNAVATTVPVGLLKYASFGHNQGHQSYMKPGDPSFCGQCQLCFKGDQGSAATTFTPPAGTWQLQARIGKSSHNDTAFVAAKPGVVATVQIGETTVPLGTAYNESYRLINRRWPTAFTVDGATPVTLTLTASSAADLVVSDDYVLVKAGTAGCSEGEELLVNGNFERTGGPFNWTPYCEMPGSGNARGEYNGYGIVSTPHSVYAPTAYEGRYAFRIQQSGGCYQKVNIPEPGTYRLSYMQAPRPGTDNGFCSTHAWIRKGTVTNELGRAICASDSWQEHVFTFKVAEAGEHYVGIAGLGRLGCARIAQYGDESHCDHTSCIDCVSLKRVDEDFAATPTVVAGAKPKLSVSSGAYLKLDFDGCLKVKSLRLGGVAARPGKVKASDYPEYLAGRGEFEVLPDGMMLIVR